MPPRLEPPKASQPLYRIPRGAKVELVDQSDRRHPKHAAVLADIRHLSVGAYLAAPQFCGDNLAIGMAECGRNEKRVLTDLD
jgi:hypothetical protein